MKKKRRTFSAEFKLRVILSALKERQIISELSQEYDLHSNQISRWKTDFLDNAAHYMQSANKQGKTEDRVDTNRLFAKIGQLQVELDFLKKSSHDAQGQTAGATG